MAALQLNLLGSPKVQRDDTPVTGFNSAKTRALLFYLAVTARRHHRSALAGLLWGHMPENVARTNLRKSVANLRKLAADHLDIDRQTMAFNRDSAYWLDVEQFETRLEPEPLLSRLEEAVELYRGDFLEGFYLPNAPEFEAWTLAQQSRLRELAVQALHQLASHYADRGEAGRAPAMDYLTRLLSLEPWREAAHRQMMLLLALSGQRGAALAQYETCCQVLAEELGVEPGDETTALYEYIRDDELDGVVEKQSLSLRSSATQTKQDWGEAPDVGIFYGRQTEAKQLRRWLIEDKCRLVGVLGMGGIGKTTLVTWVAEQVKEQFDYLIWRSLRNAPPVDEILADLIPFLSDQQVFDLPDESDKRVSLLLDLLRQKRCLLVLDNAEAILQAGARAGHYRKGYEDYGLFLQRMGESHHQSCLVLTSREKPREFAPLDGETTPVRTLKLGNIDTEAGRSLLQERGLIGSDESWMALFERYSGNPLALKLVAETVRELFLGDIAAFLHEEAAIFGGVRDLLAQQFDRLSELQQAVLIWLAIEREPVDANQLSDNLVESISRRELLENLRNVHRRSLLERTDNGFTLQNVVMEFLTDHLVETVTAEIQSKPSNEVKGPKSKI